MSDTRSQLEEIDALIAADPNDPDLNQLRDDLLQLIALEEQESAEQAQSSVQASVVEAQPSGQHAVESVAAASDTFEQKSSNYTAQGTFMEHNIVSKETVAEAPDLGSFQPVVHSSTGKSASKSQPVLKSDDANDADQANANLKDDSTNAATTTTTTQPTEKKKKKGKKKEKGDAVLDDKFELPSHLVPLESDTQAQKLKKYRSAKALKSKFRSKQKEAEHAKRQNDWQSFATKAGGKRKKGVVGSNSIFSTEEGVDARVGVVSGGGRRKMTGFEDPNKRHKFT